MEISLNTLLQGWVNECGKSASFPGPEHYAIIPSPTPAPWHLRRIIEEGIVNVGDTNAATRVWQQLNPKLIVTMSERGALLVKRASARYTTWMELARYVGPRDGPKSFVLLNGDGFELVPLQQLQTQVRNAVQNQWRHARQRLIAPYQALIAAGLDLDSIQPIHISPDQNVSSRVQVVKPPEAVLRKLPPAEKGFAAGSYRGYQYQYRLQPYVSNPPTIWQIMHRAEFTAAPAWHQILDPTADVWEVTERVHRLGQAVFRATDASGETHRWISGFDQNENPPMYFLAQLPDKGGVRYVAHAIRALAPSIVLKARLDGRRVFRQGDIFAVETDMTDDDFAGSPVFSRDQVFDNDALKPHFPFTRRGRHIRERLMIYGTGHTADQVCVLAHGTFVKGRMYHDPILENVRAGRAREHQTILLDENIWFLAVRNKVPRASTSSDST